MPSAPLSGPHDSGFHPSGDRQFKVPVAGAGPQFRPNCRGRITQRPGAAGG